MNQNMSVLDSASIRCQWTIQCQAKMQSIQTMVGFPSAKALDTTLSLCQLNL